MTVDIPDNFGELVLADRKARKMGRAQYAELTGLTQAKIANIEKGRKPRADELERLAHVVLQPATESAGAVGATPSSPTTEPAAPAPSPTGMAPLSNEGWSAEDVVRRYTEVYERLAGKPSAIPYAALWGTPGELPQFFPAIMRWCDDVDAWLNGVRNEDGPDAQVLPFPNGEQQSEPEPEPEPEPEEIVGVVTPDQVMTLEDEDSDEEDELAIVTDPPWEFPDDGIKRVSNGELKTFKRCRRKWWLAYYRRLGLPHYSVTGAAPLGSRIHRCLSVYYVPGPTPSPQVAFDELERTIAEDLEYVGSDETKVADLLKERDLAHAMLEGYFEWLAETAADQGIDVVAPETKLEVDAQMPDREVRLIAKIDVRATRTFGTDVARLFIDHKTVGDLTQPTKMLQFDEQMLHYDLCEYLDLLQSGVAADEAQAVRTDGALYNMLRKVKRTSTAKPPFYGRVEVRHNVETLRSYWFRVKGEIDEIVALEAKLNAGHDHRMVAYPTPTRDCSWDCDFYHLCTMFDDGSRAEDFIAGNLVEVNPLRRYENTTKGE